MDPETSSSPGPQANVRPERPLSATFQRRRALVAAGAAAWLAVFLLLGFPIALNRHYQVDEFHELYNGYLLANPQFRDFTLHPQPFMVLLGYIARQLDGSAEILFVSRLIFLALLISNLVIAACAQPFFPRPHHRLACLVALSGFATFWRHGLEIRHDNVGLTGCLLLYWLTVRSLLGPRRRQPLREIGSGIAFSWLMAAAHKGFVLAIPFLALFFWASWQRYRRPARTLALSAAGVIVFTLPLAGFLAVTGTTTTILKGVSDFFSHLEDLDGFSAWPRLFEIASTYPHVSCLAMIALLGAFWRARRRPWRLTASTLSGFYLLHMLVFLVINQKPFPYNFLYIVPFFFFVALDGARRIGRSLRGRPARVAAAIVMVAATVLGGLGSWHRDFYFKLGNLHQLSYIEAAEQLTDPRDDTILDGVGMVLTRPPPIPDWQLHGSFMRAYFEGRRQSFADLIRRDPPPIVLTSYRWQSLEEERGLLKERYLQMAKDFWVLGASLAEGSGELRVRRSGRYLLLTEAPGNVRVDGASFQTPAIAHLDKGLHLVDSSPAKPIVVHWIGPAEGLRLIPLPPHLPLLLQGL